MKFREAKEEEAREISKLIQESVKENFKDSSEELNCLLKIFEEEKVKEYFKEKKIYCLVDDGIIGTAVVDFRQKELNAIYLKPGCTGRGFGEIFMIFIEDEAKANKVDKLILNSTRNACGFFQKNGYWKGQEKIVDGLPAIEMEKRLR